MRVRVGGRVPNALMGMETRGLPVRAFFDLMQRGSAAELIERVFEMPATLEMDLASSGDTGDIRARLLILPLRDGADAVSKALAVIVPDRLPEDGPRRFRVMRNHLAPLDRAAPAPRPVASAAPVALVPAAGPDAASPVPAPTVEDEAAAGQGTGVPWLRVVK